MTTSDLLYETRDGVVTLTFNRPQARNALTSAMLGALQAAFDAAEQSEGERGNEVRAVVLRAAGTTFCAGGDFAAFRELIARPVPAGAQDPIVGYNRAYGATLEALAGLSVPTIAVVAGPAVGGGVGFVAASDFAFARADATFRLPEVTLGLPPAQVAPFVADRIGTPRARRLLLASESLDAGAAREAGLIDAVAQDDAELERLVATTLASIGRAEPAAVRATKQILARDRVGARGAALDFAAERFTIALRSGTASEGLAALTERRPPRWRMTFGSQA